MILASVQTGADTTPFASYAEGVGLFLAIGAAFIGACWLVDRYVITPYLQPKIDAALNHGDAQVRRFVREFEAWEAEQTAPVEANPMTATTTPEAAFAEALTAFQADIPHIGKGNKATVKSDKGNYTYDYADLTDITEAAAPLLSKHGLAWTAAPTISDHGFVLRYALIHTAGHREEGIFPLPDTSKFSAQQIGSWLTYARRYALCAVTGIAPGGDDDDAAKAGDARSVDISAPQRAQRRNGQHPDPTTVADDFAAPPVRKTDLEWMDGFEKRVTAAGSRGEVQELIDEARQVLNAGRLTESDALLLKEATDARLLELGVSV